jgi:hypothetical protein
LNGQKEFDALPDMWVDDPVAYELFLQRWGTHYIKKINVGGRFSSIGETSADEDVDYFKFAASLSASFKIGVVTGGGSAKVSLDTKDESSKTESTFTYEAHGGDPSVCLFFQTKQLDVR